jgi:hypothetical protein
MRQNSPALEDNYEELDTLTEKSFNTSNSAIGHNVSFALFHKVFSMVILSSANDAAAVVADVSLSSVPRNKLSVGKGCVNITLVLLGIVLDDDDDIPCSNCRSSSSFSYSSSQTPLKSTTKNSPLFVSPVNMTLNSSSFTSPITRQSHSMSDGAASVNYFTRQNNAPFQKATIEALLNLITGPLVPDEQSTSSGFSGQIFVSATSAMNLDTASVLVCTLPLLVMKMHRLSIDSLLQLLCKPSSFSPLQRYNTIFILFKFDFNDC